MIPLRAPGSVSLSLVALAPWLPWGLVVVFAGLVLLQGVRQRRHRDVQRRAYELTENMPAGTYVVTLTPRTEGQVDLAFRFVSRRFLEIFGVERQAVLDDPNVVLASIHPDDRERMNHDNARAFATGQPFRWEGRLLVDGVTRWYNISSNPRPAPDGVIVWEGVVTDISQRVQAQLELQRAAEREILNEQQRRVLLEQKLKTSLTAAAVVHEIQQPLAAILLNARLASQGLDQLGALPEQAGSAALQRQLLALGHDGDRVVAVMDRIRLLLRNVETRHGPFDLVASVDSALLFLKAELDQHGVTPELVGLEHPCRLQGDGAQLQIAVVNLVRNALQAMDGMKGPQRQLRLQLERHPDRVLLRLEDSGPGFPEGFSPETSWDLLHSTKATGMGLGLFLAQTAATNHHGELLIGSSAALGGAAVRLCLPLTTAAVRAPGSAAPE